MDPRVKYIYILVAYVLAVIAAGTLATWVWGGLSLADSFYYVVQVLWTIGYGDVYPPGDVGRVITLCLTFLGTVAVLSLIGIASGIVVDTFTRRHRKVIAEMRRGGVRIRERVYQWADENGVDRSVVDRVLEDVSDEQD